MKLVLILLISTTFAFAQNSDLSEQNTKQSEALENKKSKRIKRKAKGLKRLINKITHDFQTEKMILAPEKKERRRFKVIKFLEKIKNAIGPVKVKSIESENPNLLLFEVTGKTKHFKIHSAKFAVGDALDKLNWARDGQDISISEIENAKFKLEVDISEVEVGEHKLVMNIKYSLGRRQRLKLTRISKAMFEKIQTDTAHAVLVETGVNPQSSRVSFEMGDSYSDIGNIISYSVETIKDGEVVATQTIDPAVSGTFFTQSFHMVGTYQVRLTVTDESGDADSTLSKEYEVSFPAPVVEFAVTQNEEYKDIFEFDLTGTKMESGAIDYIVLYFARALEQTGGAYVELDYKFITAQTFNDSKDFKFTHKTIARGDIYVGAFVVSTDGVSNFYDIYGINVPESPKESIFLNLSHSFDRNYKPYTRGYAFPAPVSIGDFKQFNIKVTDQNGQIREYIQNDPYADSGFFHVDVDTNGPGTFTAEITLETIDGRVSLPFTTSLSFEEADLGVATLDLNLYLTPEDESRRHVNWDFNPENSNPGNFGFFNNFYCDFTERESESNFRIEKNWPQYYWIEIPRGYYDVLCFGETTSGLTSTNELKFEIDARNRAPVILNADYFLVDPVWQEYEVFIEHEDSDGWVETLKVKEVWSNGQSFEYEVYDYLTTGAYQFEGGDGTADFEIIAVDNEGLESEPYTFQIVFENESPSFNLTATLIDENTKEYQFDFEMSDDGYVEEQSITYLAPNGNEYTYDAYNSSNNFLTEVQGTWTITVTGYDNFRKSTSKSIQVEVVNNAPEVLALNIYQTEARNFDIVPDVVEQDGYIIFDELKITFPGGNIITSVPGTQSTNWSLNEAGVYQISYRAQDNSGEWSDLFTTEYEVINETPTIELSYELIDEATNTYRFDATFSDDFGDVQLFFKTTAPDGIVSEVETAFPTERVLDQVGLWEIEVTIIDGDNISSSNIKSIDILDNKILEAHIAYEKLDYFLGDAAYLHSFDSLKRDFGSYEHQWLLNGIEISTQAEISIELKTLGLNIIEYKIRDLESDESSIDTIEVNVQTSSVDYSLDAPNFIEVSANSQTETRLEFRSYNFSNTRIKLLDEGSDLYIDGDFIISKPEAIERETAVIQIIDSDEKIIEERNIEIALIQSEVIETFTAKTGNNVFTSESMSPLKGMDITLYNSEAGEIDIKLVRELSREGKEEYVISSNLDRKIEYFLSNIPSDISPIFSMQSNLDNFLQEVGDVNYGPIKLRTEFENSLLYRYCTDFKIGYESNGIGVEDPLTLIEAENQSTSSPESFRFLFSYKGVNDQDSKDKAGDQFVRRYKELIDFFTKYSAELGNIQLILLEHGDFVFATGAKSANGATYFQLHNKILLNITKIIDKKRDYWRHVLVHELQHIEQNDQLLCDISKISQPTQRVLFESNADFVASTDSEYLLLKKSVEGKFTSRRQGEYVIDSNVEAANFASKQFEDEGLNCTSNLCDPYSLSNIWSFIGDFKSVVVNKAQQIDLRSLQATDFFQNNEYVNFSAGQLLSLSTWGTFYPNNDNLKNNNDYIGFEYAGGYPWVIDRDNYISSRLADKNGAVNFRVRASKINELLDVKKVKFNLKAELPIPLQIFRLEVNFIDISNLEIISTFNLDQDDFIGGAYQFDLNSIIGEEFRDKELGVSMFNKTTDGLNLTLSAAQFTDNCNLDEFEGDYAEVNEFGGIISVDSSVDESAFIANGARVCGNSTILGENTYISGARTLIENSYVDDSCSHVFIETQGIPFVDPNDYFNTNFLRISNNSTICNGGVDTRGIVIKSYSVNSKVDISNSIIASAVNLDETDIFDSEILGDGFVNAINSFLFNSSISGSNYIFDSVLNGVNVYAPSSPFVLNDGFEFINSFQGTAMYNVQSGRKSVRGYNLIQGPVLSEISINAGTPLKNRVNGYVVLNHLRASMSGTPVSGLQTVNSTVDDSVLNGQSNEQYQSQVNAHLWRVNASGYYLINHGIDRTSIRNQETTSSFKPYEFEPWGP